MHFRFAEGYPYPCFSGTPVIEPITKLKSAAPQWYRLSNSLCIHFTDIVHPYYFAKRRRPLRAGLNLLDLKLIGKSLESRHRFAKNQSMDIL